MAQQLFVLQDDGEYLVRPAGVLLMAGSAVYGNPEETTPKGHSARRLMDNLITARKTRQ